MYNIAIDGPAGSGKSTVAGMLSEKLDILYLDTGAMYRACALKAVRLGIDPADEQAVSSFIDNVNIEVGYEGGVQHTYGPQHLGRQIVHGSFLLAFSRAVPV